MSAVSSAWMSCFAFTTRASSTLLMTVGHDDGGEQTDDDHHHHDLDEGKAALRAARRGSANLVNAVAHALSVGGERRPLRPKSGADHNKRGSAACEPVQRTLASLNCDGRSGLALLAACLLLLAPAARGVRAAGCRCATTAPRLRAGQLWRAADGSSGSPGPAACAGQCSGLRPVVGPVCPRLLGAPVAAHRVRGARGHRRGPVAVGFDRAVVRRFLGRAARHHGGRDAGAT